MIVYGDPSFEESFAALLARLQTRLESVRRCSARTASPLDEGRALLIQAGQLEQAAEDGLPGILPHQEARRLTKLVCAATDHAAAAFYACWAPDNHGAPAVEAEASGALARMALTLDAMGAAPEARLTVKIPEGFAFYALYPEQYIVATQRWLADHAPTAPPRRAVVVGIRTIGTTLSAVVAAVMAAAGWEVQRLTVRPSGHAYDRRVEIDPGELDRAAWGLIVDEGPGHSGASMAAAAAALAGAGIDRARISFLPSHDGGPTGAASEEARHWWSTARCYAVALRELCWEEQPLTEALAARTVEFCPAAGPVERVEDVGGGMWRQFVYSNPDCWPAVDAPFERTKYRCTMRDGASVLWKFTGQSALQPGSGSAAERALALLQKRAEAGWTPAPVGAALGFVALPWVEGCPLTRADADAAVLAHIGRYLARVAGPALTEPERDAARMRLREILYWNTWEALGEATAVRTRGWSDRVAGLEGEAPPPSYGDGRMAPHEWLRLPSGQLLKMDSCGHDVDHTAIGRQPLVWDVAGAMVEWGLDPNSASPLLAGLRQAGGLTYPAELLALYRMAYAAFRVGMTSLCAGMSPYPEEQARLWGDYARYRDELASLLS